MARRTQTVTIDNEKSRDHGKSFVITEMPAEQAEWWAARAIQALLSENPDIGSLGDTPLAQIASMGFKALGSLPPEKLKPLLEEMFTCISVGLPDGKTRALLSGDIEEVSTRIQLRKEILALHVGFFTLGGE